MNNGTDSLGNEDYKGTFDDVHSTVFQISPPGVSLVQFCQYQNNSRELKWACPETAPLATESKSGTGLYALPGVILGQI